MKLNSIAIRCYTCSGISHRKCANVSRYAPHVDWCCHVFNHNIPTSNYTNNTNHTTSNSTKKLTVMQWNCDYLATKISELRVVIKKYAVDIILLQETNLGLEDPTPLLEGFDAIRTVKKGSGTHKRRGGGLITYIKKGLQYSVPQCAAVSLLESNA